MEFDGIKGLGPRRIELLEKAGIAVKDDLAALFPIAYYNMEEGSFADRPSDHCAVKGRVLSRPVVRFLRKGFSVTTLACADERGTGFNVLYYNRPYLKNQVQSGRCYYFFGSITERKPTMINPIMERVEDIVPTGFYTVYPAIEGIPRAVLKAAVLDCVAKTSFRSVLAESDRSSCGLMDADEAYRALHVPHTTQEIAKAQRTVAVEELTQLMIMFRLKKTAGDRFRLFSYSSNVNVVAEKLKELPFSLTRDQLSAVAEILSDLTSPGRMNRLLQGDVGSGKTVVAFAAMYFAAASGRQAALMAPTEVLAQQHYRNYVRNFGSEGVVCLTGGGTEREKDRIRAQIADGSASVVIGTHSLFQTKCVYKALSLVVTDEQHRFGVAQRAAIENKSEGADVLIMSATPIPRTMALLIYGDLDVSVISEKPAGRMEIVTKVVPAHKIEDMFRYIAHEAGEDRRSYIVVPRVDSDDETAASVKRLYEKLKTGALRGVPMGLVYGSMKEKNEILNDFSDGRIKVLLSTTVVEVGVDVPEACNMVILDADRFGLSQLHQLRGRVGRGDRLSYCFLQTDNYSESVRNRLKFLCECSDGFKIADYDLETRGAGDFIGLSQHGFAGAVSHLPLDKETIEISRALSEKLITQSDPQTLCLKEKYARLVRNVTMN